MAAEPDHTNVTDHGSSVVAKVIFVPSDSATVFRSNPTGPADAEPVTDVPGALLANSAVRSISIEAFQDVMVAPAIPRGRVSRLASSALYCLSWADLVLLSFRIVASLPCRSGGMPDRWLL